MSFFGETARFLLERSMFCSFTCLDRVSSSLNASTDCQYCFDLAFLILSQYFLKEITYCFKFNETVVVV